MYENASPHRYTNNVCPTYCLCKINGDVWIIYRIGQDLKLETNQVISSNLTWKVLRLLPKIRNLSQYVPAALAALLVPDG